jgi:NADPH-dependent 2,4-dienoyl-CoA reductase/sulfur reductase-like enzyme
MTLRVVVIGCDATGASAASTVKRALGDDAHVLVLERQQWTSYSACGIPYWVAGEVDGPDTLIARTPEQHRRNGLDLRTGVEVTSIDLAAQTVTARYLTSGSQHTHPYDHLVIATGAKPIRPPLEGIALPGVHGIQTMDDGMATLDSLDEGAKRAVVVGAGYIGIEMAEAMLSRGLEVRVLDKAPQPMSTLDPDMGRLIADQMGQMGIPYHGGEPVASLEEGADGRVALVRTATEAYPADVVVLGLGVRPNARLAREAGLPLGEHGGILTDDRMQVQGHENVWAGGDCVEVLDRTSQQHRHVPLGTHANKHGRIIGTNLGGGDLRFPGVVGTAVSKILHLEISRVGLRTAEAAELGFDPVSAVIEASTRAHYFPGSGDIHVKVIADRGTGRLLGCQIVGLAEGAGKRIDAAAVAMWHELTVEEVTNLDLAYAPPFSPVWDPVQIAARRVAGMLQRAR